MTGLDADATDQAASTPHARRPAPLAHAGPVFPPASAAEHATRHLGRRGRQSVAPDGEARQEDDAMSNAVRCGAAGLACGVWREEGGDEAESQRALHLHGSTLSYRFIRDTVLGGPHGGPRDTRGAATICQQSAPPRQPGTRSIFGWILFYLLINVPFYTSGQFLSLLWS
jgi:hypothetical protein